MKLSSGCSLFLKSNITCSYRNKFLHFQNFEGAGFKYDNNFIFVFAKRFAVSPIRAS